METVGIKTRSIFDIMEERKEMSAEFKWSKDSSQLKYSTEEFVYESILFTYQPSTNTLKAHKYVLTLRGLIKQKVLWFSYIRRSAIKSYLKRFSSSTILDWKKSRVVYITCN